MEDVNPEKPVCVDEKLTAGKRRRSLTIHYSSERWFELRRGSE